MADLLVRPSFLTGLLILDLVLLVWRSASIIDAFVISAPVEDRGWLTVPLAFLLLLIALPHAMAGSYVTRTIDTLNTVFVAAPADQQIAALTPLGPRSPTTTLALPIKFRPQLTLVDANRLKLATRDARRGNLDTVDAQVDKQHPRNVQFLRRRIGDIRRLLTVTKRRIHDRDAHFLTLGHCPTALGPPP
jgi:hypothetical protein